MAVSQTEKSGAAHNRHLIEPGVKHRGAEKMNLIPAREIPVESQPVLPKPDWLRVKVSNPPEVSRIKKILRSNSLNTVCEEASCPNLAECFGSGTATFMIMGDICTRRCPFCDVAHGRPNPLDKDEPEHLARAIAQMSLSHVVITSVDRDDLADAGAGHFADCIAAIRALSPTIKIEILVPDFRGRMVPALDTLSQTRPDIFNHNLETVPALYKKARPGANYLWSLELLKQYKERNPDVISKSGIMLGLGENNEQVIGLMEDMRRHAVDMITLGQYLQPSKHHLPVMRYVHPDEFAMLADTARQLGFRHVASGALVRSSYHADLQAEQDLVI